MKRVIIIGASAAAIALGGCSLFESGSSDRSGADAGSVRPAPTATTQPMTGPTASQAPANAPASTSAAATGTTTSHDKMAAHRKMATRDDVRAAQEKLAVAGLYQGKIDGIAGPQTRQALQQFQKQHGLPATGRLDRKTMAQLASNEQQTTGTGSTNSGRSGAATDTSKPAAPQSAPPHQ